MKEGWMVKLTPYLEKATLKNPNLIRVNNLLDITSSFDFSVFLHCPHVILLKSTIYIRVIAKDIDFSLSGV